MLRLKVLEYPIVDREAWRDWRRVIANNLQACSASMISGFFGHNYVSYKATLLEHKGVAPARDQWQMADTAKKHGEDNEPNAKRAFTEIVKRRYGAFSLLDNGENTYLSMIADLKLGVDSSTSFIMWTPDMIAQSMGTKYVVEFKCPYFELYSPALRKSRTILQIASDYLGKYKVGRESSFLQALVYAYFAETETFMTCYYFTDTISEAMIVYKYRIVDVGDASRSIFRAAWNIKQELAKEPGDIKARTSSLDKKWMTRFMEKCFSESFIYRCTEKGKWVQLNEESPDNSEEDGPEEPWKPCSL